jgi:hypothetical protein
MYSFEPPALVHKWSLYVPLPAPTTTAQRIAAVAPDAAMALDAFQYPGKAIRSQGFGAVVSDSSDN